MLRASSSTCPPPIGALFDAPFIRQVADLESPKSVGSGLPACFGLLPKWDAAAICTIHGEKGLSGHIVLYGAHACMSEVLPRQPRGLHRNRVNGQWFDSGNALQVVQGEYMWG